jgi:hypothetical protein
VVYFPPFVHSSPGSPALLEKLILVHGMLVNHPCIVIPSYQLSEKGWAIIIRRANHRTLKAMVP